MYYLQSRYYDPELGRFINVDSYVSTGQGFIGANMFAYCLNNPVNMADYDGEDAIYVVAREWPAGLPVFGHAVVYLEDDNGQWYKTQFTGSTPWNATIKVYDPISDIDLALQQYNQDKTNVMRISGDFSEVIGEIGNIKENTNGYCFFGNNCNHYAKKLLTHEKAKIDDELLRNYLHKTPAMIPIVYYHVVNNASVLDNAWNNIRTFANNAWNYVRDIFT